MRAGKLDKRIALLRRATATDDGLGIVPGALSRLGWRWASFKAERGTEGFENEGKQARATASVWLRSDALTRSLQATDKLAIDGLVYELVAPPAAIGRREGVELFVRAEDGETVDADVLAEWSA